MDSFCGLIAPNTDKLPELASRSFLGEAPASSIRLESSASELAIEATERWAARTTPEFHCVAVGYALDEGLGALDAKAMAGLISDKGISALRGRDGCYVACQVERATIATPEETESLTGS